MTQRGTAASNTTCRRSVPSWEGSVMMVVRLDHPERNGLDHSVHGEAQLRIELVRFGRGRTALKDRPVAGRWREVEDLVDVPGSADDHRRLQVGSCAGQGQAHALAIWGVNDLQQSFSVPGADLNWLGGMM